MPQSIKDMSGFENEHVLVLSNTGASNSKGSILWETQCKHCGNIRSLPKAAIERSTSCKSCYTRNRVYKEVTKLCVVCSTPFTRKENSRKKTCSSTCKNKYLANYQKERSHKSVESKLRERISQSLSRSKHRENSSLDVDSLVDKCKKRGWTCEQTGIPFEVKGAFAPSVDRIDSDKPYVDDNVQIVCWIYNRCKQADTDEDVLYFATKLLEQQEK